jgi:hypothetical protein
MEVNGIREIIPREDAFESSKRGDADEMNSSSSLKIL